jgi:hypothetical protein
MINRRNYYRVLHVEPDAPTAVIQASYRALMQQLTVHPDLGGDHDEAVLINEAFDTLRDPDRRAAYDRTIDSPRHQRGRAGGPQTALVPVTPRQLPAPPGEAPDCAFCGTATTVVERRSPDAICTSCGSALYPAPLQPGDGSARRALGRVRTRMPMTFRVGATPHMSRSGTAENLNIKGMQFRSDVAIPVGERLQIDCEFCSAVAIVRTIRNEAWGSRRGSHYGVEFLTLLIKRERGGLVSTVA